MFILDDVRYFTIEEAAKASKISLSVLKNHINDTWKSKSGVEHTLTEVEDTQPAAEEVEDIPESVCATFDVPTLDRLVKVAKPEQVLHMPCLHRKKKSGAFHSRHTGNSLYSQPNQIIRR